MNYSVCYKRSTPVYSKKMLLFNKIVNVNTVLLLISVILIFTYTFGVGIKLTEITKYV